MTGPVNKSDAEWRESLSSEQYRILREAGTERPFSGDLLSEKRAGRFLCAGCGKPLFASDSKYESGSGWPSFTEPITPDAVRFVTDSSHGMTRTEVRCGRCDAHLGHVFPDGPGPSGERYCMNSASLLLESEST